MKLLGLIFDNAGLKILAFGMAWAVWFMVSQSLSADRPVPMQLRIEYDRDAVLATHKDAAGTGSTITITVAGPASAVGDFERVAARTEAILRVGPEHHPQEPEEQAVFSLDDLEIPDLANFPGLRAVKMEPPEIRLNIERMEVQDKPVERPVITETPSSVDVRIVTWDTVVKIRASAKHLAQRLAKIRTSVDPEVLRQLAASVGEAPSITEEVELTVDPGQRPLFELVGQERISVRLELRQNQEATFTVPVRILRAADTDAAGDRPLRFSPGNDVDVRLQDVYIPGEDGAPPQLRLVLEGSPAAIANVDPAKILAFVLEEEMPTEDVLANLVVHVSGLPGGVRVKFEITLAVER
jgi:hypothetical protein